MTLPTKLSFLRIVLTFFVMALLFVDGLPAKIAALVVFLIAGLTDWLDGFLARRFNQISSLFNQISSLGILLDPIADKVLVLGTFLAFVQLRLIPAWMVLLIALREFLITGVRLLALNRHIVLPAVKEGKHKTISQMLTILVVFLTLIVQEMAAPGSIPHGIVELMHAGVLVCLWVTVVLTVFSGASFLWNNRNLFADASGR
ncbi:MAG: CDP-diacylglycerol--glycerol-3-phosphate 3-phosphatidyltransferase [Candidatus Omnitrophica bacterium]|nr:CDP-diacylglycerol--glycerol-3-phosphate 3-phosphatidyltransferase [Candidatus Omnitrophota bacterium]